MASLRDRAAEIAAEEGVPPWLFVRQMEQENGHWDPDVISGARRSKAGAAGVAQLMPVHWGNVDPLDPEAALRYAARLDAGYLHKYAGNQTLMLAAYNAGPGAVDQYGGIPPYGETDQYIGAILGMGGRAPMTGPATPYDEAAYADLAAEVQSHEAQIHAYQDTKDKATKLLLTGSGLDDATRNRFQKAVNSMAVALGLVDPKAAGQDVSPATVVVTLNSLIKSEKEQLNTAADQLFTVNPKRASTEYGQYATKQRLTLAGAGTDTTPKKDVVQTIQGSDGSIYTVDNTGAVTNHGQFPGIGKDRPYTITTNPKTGALTAYDPQHPEAAPIIIDPNFGYKEVDPAIKYADDQDHTKALIAQAQAQTAQAYSGIDLARRGALIAAYGQDVASQVLIGKATTDEAQLNLNRINDAFTQRREERAQVLANAVKSTSLSTDANGQTVTTLPFAGPLAAILGQSTGQPMNPEDFKLPTVTANPDRTANDVLNASSYTSQIPALTDTIARTRQAIQAVLGPVAGAVAANDAAAGNITKGV